MVGFAAGSAHPTFPYCKFTHAVLGVAMRAIVTFSLAAILTLGPLTKAVDASGQVAATPDAAQPAPVSPHAVCGPVGIADARWTTGFWADRFEVCRSATIPAMGALMEG